MKGRLTKKRLRLHCEPYNLELKYVFTLSVHTRSITPVVLTEIDYDGITGYGEASLPPYLGETQQSVMKFISELKLDQFTDPLQMDEILDYVDKSYPGNVAAKASIDIALHDLMGKLLGKPLYKMWGFSKMNTLYTSFTIGMDSLNVIRQKVLEAKEFKIIKVKLGSDYDKKIIETVCSVTDADLCVDVNQGWNNREIALEMIYWLEEKGVKYIEQPLPKEQIDDHAWLTENSPIPVIADEAVQRLSDLKKIKDTYSGINIKLMKCTGLREARKMVDVARSYGMKIMIGCMTETSCGISAASQISPGADWADLDGNLLIKNDPFKGVRIRNGKIELNELPGIGLYGEKLMK